MLTDVDFNPPDPRTVSILSLITEGRGAVIPERLEKGLYLCGHWNIDQLGLSLIDVYGLKTNLPDGISRCGVCDYPKQVLEKYPILEKHSAKYFVSFVHLRRADEPKNGGWRWRKWGEYIGDRDPKCEYLADEPDIEEVYTYHVYELE